MANEQVFLKMPDASNTLMHNMLADGSQRANTLAPVLPCACCDVKPSPDRASIRACRFYLQSNRCPPLTFTPLLAQDTTATFEEHEALKLILRNSCGRFDIQTVCEFQTRRAPYPVFPGFTACIGSADPLAPAVGFFGGIHGLERIGSQLVLSYMQSLL